MADRAGSLVAGRLGDTVLLLGLGLLLLARLKGLVELSVDEEVAQYTTGTPRHAVGPSLDPTGVLLVDEYVSAGDQVAPLAIMRPPRNVLANTSEAPLYQIESVHGAATVALPGRLQRSSSAGLAGRGGHSRHAAS